MILHLFLGLPMLLDIDSNNITETIKWNYTQKKNKQLKMCAVAYFCSFPDRPALDHQFFPAASDFHCLHSPSVINDYDGVYKFLLNVAL